jgi:superfamily II DNA or RNA helicase
MNHLDLTNQGVVILKNKLTKASINKIKKDLTVKPHLHPDYADDVESYPVYIETTEHLIIPRFYSHNYKDINIINQGLDIDITFTGVLREQQIEISNSCLKDITNIGGGMISLPCGTGKCLAQDTPVIMYDLNVKKVQDIKPGDLLLGDDSGSRLVTSTVCGYDYMFDIECDANIKYSVNSSHILSLVYIGPTNNNYKSNSIIDISVSDLYYSNMCITNFKGYRTVINNKDDNYDFDLPYLNGYNLYDPSNYVKSNLNTRLNYLAGLFDKFLSINISVDQNYLNNIIFICRSVGLKIITNHNTNSITVYGNINIIPCRIFKNGYHKNNQPNLTYDIRIFKRDINKYYGFSIDDKEVNKRFVLGDMTVTHNTTISLYLSSILKKKTLVVVHKSFLLNQWIERIKQFTNAKIGIIRQKKIDVENKDIVVGMLQSISMKEYDDDLFKQFGCVIFDEAHHCASRIFFKALQKTSSKYMIGLSATPNRLDKLTKVLHWYMGPIIYKLNRKGDNRVYVKNIKYFSTDKKLFVEKKQWKSGKVILASPKMITNLTKINDRNKLIINLINKLRENSDRKILILSGRLDHLTLLKDSIDLSIKKDIESGVLEPDEYKTAYYIGKMKAYELEFAEEASIIFATYAMAEEGLDIDKLNTLIMVTPKKNIEQSVGRILRKPIKDGDISPLIIDINDQFSCFEGWGDYRIKYFNKQKYTIDTCHILNEDPVSTREYLYKKNIITKEKYEDKDHDLRKEVIIHEYGVDHYELLKDIDFEDEPVEKYVFDKINLDDFLKTNQDNDDDKDEIDPDDNILMKYRNQKN